MRDALGCRCSAINADLRALGGLGSAQEAASDACLCVLGNSAP